MENMKTAKTPMAEDFTVYACDIPDKVDNALKLQAQSLEESLLFITMWSCPNISQAVSLLSLFVSNP